MDVPGGTSKETRLPVLERGTVLGATGIEDLGVEATRVALLADKPANAAAVLGWKKH